jgi:hypothetical protein
VLRSDLYLRCCGVFVRFHVRRQIVPAHPIAPSTNTTNSGAWRRAAMADGSITACAGCSEQVDREGCGWGWVAVT